MLICIHCTLKSIVNGERPDVRDDESPDEHIARVHADPAADAAERPELERKAAKIIERRRAMANNYRSN